ncbi:hypothetical protein OHA01_13065 [Micromonospora zamorensis]|uniref:hypothetical protein n=1 Tax=Micromonospora zamorensis TaxID=709883 RepID=UPI0033EA504F|nr:hypothetical protein OHA01_13065 [Micromonospora zamorensis]
MYDNFGARFGAGRAHGAVLMPAAYGSLGGASDPSVLLPRPVNRLRHQLDSASRGHARPERSCGAAHRRLPSITWWSVAEVAVFQLLTIK